MKNECRSFRKDSSAFFIRFLFFFLLLTSYFSLFTSAQIIDSIRTSFRKKPGIAYGFGTNTSFINGFISPIFTAYAGLDFNHFIQTGVGMSWLQLSPYKKGKDNFPFYRSQIITDAQGKSDTVRSALSFRYFNFHIEYDFYKTKRWQFSVPLVFGVGNSYYNYTYRGEKTKSDKHLIFLYEPAVSGTYKLLNWFGFGLDIEYRIMLINNKAIGGKFTSPVFSASTVVFWDELYRMFFPKK